MQTKPKLFRCENCQNETYTDRQSCLNCKEENTIKPIPKKRYQCFLNGTYYGSGTLEYMHELFTDYVLYSKMYGKESCSFSIHEL